MLQKELLSSKYLVAIELRRSQIGWSRAAGHREDGKLLLAKCLIRWISYWRLGERWMRLKDEEAEGTRNLEDTPRRIRRQGGPTEALHHGPSRLAPRR